MSFSFSLWGLVIIVMSCSVGSNLLLERKSGP